MTIAVDFFAIALSIGSFVFLLQQTDFIYEYGSLLCQIFKLKKLDLFLKFDHYRSNSDKFETYISFLGSFFGVKNNFIGFFVRLLSCFICLSCFMSLIINLLINSSILYILPCFFISAVTYFILFLIKKKIYS